MEVDNENEVETLKTILEQIDILEKGVDKVDRVSSARVLRSLPLLRKSLTPALFELLSENSKILKLKTVQKFLSPKETLFVVSPDLYPEVECFLNLLHLLFLFDSKSAHVVDNATLLLERISGFNRRTLDTIAAKCLHFCGIIFRDASKLEELLPHLSKRLTISCQKKDWETQSVLTNLLLMSFVDSNNFEMAKKFSTKVVFPEEGSMYEMARYLYFQGRIRAVELDYSSALEYLVSALRKAPERSALGFRQTLHKFITVVQLLTGEVPDRVTFRNSELKSCMAPYLKLSQAVHNGDLNVFNEVLVSHSDTFIKDKTHSLIVRLRHNVLKAGLRKICQSYSKISLDQITSKLQLESLESARFIVIKAIKDGVISGKIDQDNDCLVVNEVHNVYSSMEPFSQFEKRISFCNTIRNEGVKAMRYPKKKFNSNYSKDLEMDEDMFDDDDESEDEM